MATRSGPGDLKAVTGFLARALIGDLVEHMQADRAFTLADVITLTARLEGNISQAIEHEVEAIRQELTT